MGLPHIDFAPIGADELIEREERGIRFVTINRPRQRNALSLGILAGLRATFALAAKDSELRAIVLTGSGHRAFASGGDLNELEKFRTPAEARALSEFGKAALNAIRDCPIPVVAAVNGFALGGGAELALACDLRIAAPHAKIGFIHSRLAIAPSWGGGVDLMRLVGFAEGLELLSFARELTATEARELGVVNQVAAVSQPFEEEIEAFVGPLRSLPVQVARSAKALSLNERSRDREPLQAAETRHFMEVWAHPDHWTALEAIANRKRRDAS